MNPEQRAALVAFRDEANHRGATLDAVIKHLDRYTQTMAERDAMIARQAEDIARLKAIIGDNETDPPPPTGLPSWHPDAHPDRWTIRTGHPPPQPGPGGQFRDVRSRDDWNNAWAALNDNDVLRILEAPPETNFVGYGKHFTAGKNPWIWQRPDLRVNGDLRSGWAAVDLINCSNINGMGLHSVRSDYGVRLSGVQGSPVHPCLFVDCDAIDSRMASFVAQWDGTGRKGIPKPTFRPTAHVDFYDLNATGWSGTAPQHSETLYVSSSGTYGDPTHDVRAFRVRGARKASEVVEVKPGATNCEFQWITADDIDTEAGDRGPTGVISIWVSGSASTAPYPIKLSDPNIRIRHVRTRNTKLHGHGVITPGFGGVTIANVYSENPDGAVVRAWSKRPFTGTQNMAPITTKGIYTTSDALIANAWQTGPRPSFVREQPERKNVDPSDLNQLIELNH